MRQDILLENQALREKLDRLMIEAWKNEKKLRRFQAQELHLIGLNSLRELFERLVHPEYSLFDWDMVSLMLIDPDYEIQRILESGGYRPENMAGLRFLSEGKDLETLYPYSLFPYLGRYRRKCHVKVFSDLHKRAPSSVALLPLVRQGRLIGSLNLGSYREDRFCKGARTDFLEHLSAVVAICIENASNHERLEQLGLIDPLTAVNNRRYFDQRLGETIEWSLRRKEPLSCFLMDIDHFKMINDQYGHQKGDEVLQKVAALIRSQMRGSDVLCRYGGEEFAALLPQTDEAMALDVAERIRSSIEHHDFHDDAVDQRVTISIGVSVYLPDESVVGLDHSRLVGLADQGLYEAKSQGRNRISSCLVIEDQEACYA